MGRASEVVRRLPAGTTRGTVVAASGRAAAESLAHAGVSVDVCDRFGDVDTRAVAENWFDVGEPPADGAVVVGGDVDVDWLSRTPWGRIRRESSDPTWLASVAAEAGIDFPDWSWNVREAGGGRWLVKHRRGSGGTRVRWLVGDHGPGAVGVDGPGAAGDEEYVQRFTPGRRYGVTIDVVGGRGRVVGWCRSLVHRVGDRPFVYGGSFGPVTPPVDVGRLADVIARRIPGDGPIGVDVVLGRAGEATLIEVNPRYTASMELIERGRGSLLIDGGWAGGHEPDASWKRVVYARRSFRWTGRTGTISDGRLADVPKIGAVVRRGDPVVTLLADAGSFSPMRRAVGRAVMRMPHCD